MAVRGLGAPGVRICYERAEPLCHSLDRPLLLYAALMSQWRHTLATDKMSSAMQIAEQVYILAQKQNDATLMIGAYRALAGTFYYSGDFEAARKYAIRGVQLWRSGGVQSYAEFLDAPAVVCLCYQAVSEWHLGEIASCHARIAEAISLAKELNDMHGLAVALNFSAMLGHLSVIQSQWNARHRI